ncbi:unnamed protein product [Cyclocybe aegerita]|uniref:Fungal-type protein kinase domain-containing protein n=1 Tax=Cyclocybe aegerita TaxID=1973307 RepID=A0A8S0WDD4_CYCAE|nr:unnamed protein product [Cyclocybe aegerita]
MAFEVSPSNSSEDEDITFSPLQAICEKISEFPLIRGDLENTIANFAFIQTLSEMKGSNHKIDGFFKPINLQLVKDEKIPSSTVADVLDNRLKILAAVNHIMNEGPRRMFTYGITIEEDDITFSKSRHFGFFADPKTFVSVLLSFILATETELGFDPTISRLSPVSYVYQVSDRFFKTIRMISEYQPLCIADRMTRVWEAVEVASFIDPTPKRDARSIALKDVWLDASGQTEKEIQAALFSDLEEFRQVIESKDPEQFTNFTEEMKAEIRDCLKGEVYKKHFLNIECDYQGKIRRQSRHRLTSLVPAAEPSSHLQPTTPASPALSRKYAPKQQYRVVFKQSAASTALQLLYCAGWLHRDISSGNLLWFDSGDGNLQMVLGDLEYAKRFRAGIGSPDSKTGTSYFMPYEVHEGLHLYLSQPRQPMVPIQEFVLFKQQQVPPIFVRHSFQHGLESLWWVQLWCVIERINETSLQYANKIFQTTYRPSTDRQDAFLVPGILATNLKTSLPPDMHRMLIGTEHERIVLVDHYIRREQENKLEDIASYSETYAVFHDDQSYLKEICPAMLLAPIRQVILVQTPS